MIELSFRGFCLHIGNRDFHFLVTVYTDQRNTWKVCVNKLASLLRFSFGSVDLQKSRSSWEESRYYTQSDQLKRVQGSFYAEKQGGSFGRQRKQRDGP